MIPEYGWWICDGCLLVFSSSWTDEEAQMECRAVCGDVPINAQTILCDRCVALWHWNDTVNGQPTPPENLVHWIIDTDHMLTQLVAA